MSNFKVGQKVLVVNCEDVVIPCPEGMPAELKAMLPPVIKLTLDPSEVGKIVTIKMQLTPDTYIIEEGDELLHKSWLDTAEVSMIDMLLELAREGAPEGLDLEACIDICLPVFEEALANGTKPDFDALTKAVLAKAVSAKATTRDFKKGDIVVVGVLPEDAPAEMLAMAGTAAIVEDTCPNVMDDASDIIIKLAGSDYGWYPQHLTKL